MQDIAKIAGEQQRQLADLTGEARSAQAQARGGVDPRACTSMPCRRAIAQPRNLRQGIYRGGRQPVRDFLRVSNGINPSNMPGIASQRRA